MIDCPRQFPDVEGMETHFLASDHLLSVRCPRQFPDVEGMETPFRVPVPRDFLVRDSSLMFIDNLASCSCRYFSHRASQKGWRRAM